MVDRDLAKDLNQNQDDVYIVDDAFMGAKVLAIDQLMVIILNEGAPRVPRSDARPSTLTPESARTKPMAGCQLAGGPVEGIKKLDDRHFQIERSTVNNALGNLNDLAMQARIVPSFKNGQANGFKLFSIKPGTVSTRRSGSRTAT